MRVKDWIVVVGIVVAVGGCQAEKGHLPGAEFNGTVTSRDPATLVSLLASTTTPEDSRRSADRLLVQAKGKTDPTRLAVLEQMLYAPGHSDGMRIYAMDQLADADPARADRAIGLYLPRFEDGENGGGVLSHACRLAVRLGDERLCEPLIESMARNLVAEGSGEDAASLKKRPEWGAIQKLGGRPVEETLYRMVETGVGTPVRVASLDLLQTLEPADVVMKRVSAMPGEEKYLVDLRWWIGMFGTLPMGENETRWIEFLHRPEQGALVGRALARHKELAGQADYRMAPRFVAVLAYASEEDVGQSRDVLVTALRGELKGHAHAQRTPAYPHSPEDVNESLDANLGRLSRGDLLALRLLLQTLRSPAAIGELQRQGLEDLSDTATEHGGLLSFENIREPVLVATPYAPYYNENDFEYITGDDLVQKTVNGVAQYHFHFQQIYNAARAGPGEGDLGYVKRARCNCVVITSVETRKMDIDYYTPAGAVVDLGVYEAQ